MAVDQARADVGEHAGEGATSLPFLSGVDDAIKEAWDGADAHTKRDLLRLAIDKITVRKAHRQGARSTGTQN